ncbi:hypothetical protein [Tolypothrix sp. NIES-4075]|uniref:hypothetical protein n=1 Tax=Tolypothrix sp. NIES-4075 TaxID=2005459 RepID=UPI000B5CDF03|nr:hypothetical protein [Tolypothrix sp. NIES-4075]
MLFVLGNSLNASLVWCTHRLSHASKAASWLFDVAELFRTYAPKQQTINEGRQNEPVAWAARSDLSNLAFNSQWFKSRFLDC